MCAGSSSLLDGRSGYLSSHMSVERAYGSSRCPWKIPLNSGQYVNITLHHFISTSSPAYLLHPNACYNVMQLRQNSNIENVRICTNDPREKHVLISYDRDVELTFLDQHSIENVGHFVVYYEGEYISYDDRLS